MPSPHSVAPRMRHGDGPGPDRRLQAPCHGGVRRAAPAERRKELAAGKLLVAARGLRDPNFSETVILLAEHSAESSMGLVINRRTDVPLARLFPNLQEAQGAVRRGVPGRPRLARRRAGAAALHDAVGRQSSRAWTTFMWSRPARISRRRLPQEAQIPALPDVSRLRGLGPGAAGARDTAGLVARLQGDTARSSSDPEPDTVWQRQMRRTEGADGASLPVAPSTGIDSRRAPRGQKRGQRPHHGHQPHRASPASRRRGPRARTATR